MAQRKWEPWVLYALSAIGIAFVIVINSEEQQIDLLSWQNAALVGYAALVAATTAVLVRLFRARVGS
ncbi:MAG: hypothetical protein AAGE01_02290 [Pseudomonadota bacterium]